MPGRILVDFAPLRESRDFRWLFSGTLISTLGSQLTVVAIPYQVYELTHSSFQVGAVSLAQLIPLVLGSLIGGSIGDAVDRRTLMFVSTGLLVFTSVALAANALAASPSLAAIYVVSAVAAALNGFVSTARLASTPVLVKPEHLSAAYAFNQIVFQVGTVVGPALSGLLLRPIGLAGVYSIDAGTYAVCTLTCLAISRIPPTPGAAAPGIGSIVEGVRYLKGRHAIQGVFLIDINAMVFGMPRALFPALAANRFHAAVAETTVLGFLYAAPGAGALLGAFITGWVSHLRRQGWAIVAAVLAWGGAVALFGVTDILWLALVLLAIAGWADVISAVLRNTVLQASVPDTFRSRLSSFQIAVVTGGPRLGDMEAGTVASLAGNEFSIVSGGLACMVGAMVLVGALPGFRRYRNPLSDAAASDGAAPVSEPPPD
jgi:predicted MFS family arabinose efflux permease